MKIGILTFHRATNYGAVLQAYALVHYLNKNEEYDAKIVDYKPKGMGVLYASLDVSGLYRKLKRIILNILMLFSLKKRYNKRKMFWNYIKGVLPMTDKVDNVDMVPDMDAFIVGSDQVWSVCFTGGLDPFYWGLFERKGAKMISYAASAAENMEDSFFSSGNSRYLETFDFISVRESELQQYLQKEISTKDIVKVLDPTLMAGADIFEELIKNEKPLAERYILIYQVVRVENDNIQEYAIKMAHQNDCNVVEIKNSQLWLNSNGKTTILKELVTPTQFVSLFKNAQFIITTSFHGTAFSLLFNRPFLVVSVSEEVDSRAKDILVQLGIEERLVLLPLSNNVIKEINWELVNEKLGELRIPSREFLKQSLS